MNTHTSSTAPLSFQEWLQKNHPTLNGVEKLYKLLGVYDLFYLVYRLQQEPTKKTEDAHAHAPVKRAVRKVKKQLEESEVGEEGAGGEEGKVGKVGKVSKVSKVRKEKKKKVTKKKAAAKKKPTSKKTEEKLPDSLESLASSDSSLPSEALAKDGVSSDSSSTLLWLNAKELEDVEDLRKTDLQLGVNGIAVSFSKKKVDDEEETLLHVGSKTFKILLPSPSLDLSRMAQTVKVSYGELYVLGRAALGAISGEGYIAPEEATRIVQELDATEETSFTLGVSYFNKDATSTTRTDSVVTLRFNRVDR